MPRICRISSIVNETIAPVVFLRQWDTQIRIDVLQKISRITNSLKTIQQKKNEKLRIEKFKNTHSLMNYKNIFHIPETKYKSTIFHKAR